MFTYVFIVILDLTVKLQSMVNYIGLVLGGGGWWGWCIIVLNVEAPSQGPLPLTLLYTFVLFLIEKMSLL